jgi:hypothetical protein
MGVVVEEIRDGLKQLVADEPSSFATAFWALCHLV